jgi:hypothetical protein
MNAKQETRNTKKNACSTVLQCRASTIFGEGRNNAAKQILRNTTDRNKKYRGLPSPFPPPKPAVRETSAADRTGRACLDRHAARLLQEINFYLFSSVNTHIASAQVDNLYHIYTCLYVNLLFRNYVGS